MKGILRVDINMKIKKILNVTIYSFFVLLIGFMVYRVSLIKNYSKYYKENIDNILTNYTKEKYMELYFTSELYDKYQIEPIYNLVSKDNTYPFEFSIYHAEKDEQELLVFYFDDRNPSDLTKKIDYDNIVRNKEEFNNNIKKVIIRINIFMEGGEFATTNYFHLDRTERRPVSLIRIGKDNNSFEYLKKKTADDMKPKIDTSNKIEKVELLIEDHTKKSDSDDKTKLTNILTINSNDNEYNFSGKFSDLYEKVDYSNNENIHIIDKSVFKTYHKNINKTMIIYSFIALFVTYIFYFLPTTIKFIRRRVKKAN